MLKEALSRIFITLAELTTVHQGISHSQILTWSMKLLHLAHCATEKKYFPINFLSESSSLMESRIFERD